eukprot:TRINITY_DN82554_c0_g1_i1.p1 TRINITY_DN82554_c0_g1~~TRINITY_DN82554_c0_g1_i1.p1  ORF type:complete len:180 (-),score=50.72 TRINITY_DN82554_c0_g1_i1:226-765(-)
MKAPEKTASVQTVPAGIDDNGDHCPSEAIQRQSEEAGSEEEVEKESAAERLARAAESLRAGERDREQVMVEGLMAESPEDEQVEEFRKLDENSTLFAKSAANGEDEEGDHSDGVAHVVPKHECEDRKEERKSEEADERSFQERVRRMAAELQDDDHEPQNEDQGAERQAPQAMGRGNGP